MRNRRAKWLSGVGAVVLIGGLVLANYGGGVQSVGAQAAPPNPLTVILDKLDQILTAIGGLAQSNPTLRWDQALPAAQRFVVLAAFNSDAVLDRETGLVWEKSPAVTPHTWSNARFHCANRNVGGRKGWRLSSFAELSSLVDPSVAPPGPTLPPGHPFMNVQSALYWSAPAGADVPAIAWLVYFSNGVVFGNGKASTFHAWCVRGPMQESVY